MEVSSLPHHDHVFSVLNATEDALETSAAVEEWVNQQFSEEYSSFSNRNMTSTSDLSCDTLLNHSIASTGPSLSLSSSILHTSTSPPSTLSQGWLLASPESSDAASLQPPTPSPPDSSRPYMDIPATTASPSMHCSHHDLPQNIQPALFQNSVNSNVASLVPAVYYPQQYPMFQQTYLYPAGNVATMGDNGPILMPYVACSSSNGPAISSGCHINASVVTSTPIKSSSSPFALTNMVVSPAVDQLRELQVKCSNSAGLMPLTSGQNFYTTSMPVSTSHSAGLSADQTRQQITCDNSYSNQLHNKPYSLKVVFLPNQQNDSKDSTRFTKCAKIVLHPNHPPIAYVSRGRSIEVLISCGTSPPPGSYLQFSTYSLAGGVKSPVLGYDHSHNPNTNLCFVQRCSDNPFSDPSAALNDDSCRSSSSPVPRYLALHGGFLVMMIPIMREETLTRLVFPFLNSKCPTTVRRDVRLAISLNSQDGRCLAENEFQLVSCFSPLRDAVRHETKLVNEGLSTVSDSVAGRKRKHASEQDGEEPTITQVNGKKKYMILTEDPEVWRILNNLRKQLTPLLKTKKDPSSFVVDQDADDDDFLDD